MSGAFGGTMEGARIKVVGVGGGGGNAVNTMIQAGMGGVDFLAANTDGQALGRSLATIKVQLGNEITKGLGAGARPATGREAALEDADMLRQLLSGADMVFVTAGMGGGTGTGAAPVIAGIAREVGALTVGVVTKPFLFEGKRRLAQAEEGILALKPNVDALITIPNQRLLSVASRNMPILEAFRRADDVLLQAVRGIADLISVDGLINLDFADVRTIMSEMGMAMMGAAMAEGENRAIEAAQRAISSPLLDDVSIQGARGVLINITGGSDLSLSEVNDAATLIQEEAHEEANIIFGAVIDETMGDKIRITVIATGFGEEARAALPTAQELLRPRAATPPAQAQAPAAPRPDLRRGPAPAPLSSAQAAKAPSGWARAAAAVGRKVVRMGTIEDENGVPSFHSAAPEIAERGPTNEPALRPLEDDEADYDIPTFLRKQAD